MDMGEMWKLDFGERAGFSTDIFPLHHRHNNRFNRW